MRKTFSKRAIILVIGLAAAGYFAVSQQTFVQPAFAKGIVRTPSKDDSEEKKEDDRGGNQTQRSEQPRTEQPNSSGSSSSQSDRTERRDDSSSSGSNSSTTIWQNREERSDSSQRTEPQVRDKGTPDVSGQYMKRDERRDPEYRYRRHYIDPFYHAYDFEFYSTYPDYDGGTVIIIDKDTWREPHRWRRTYHYDKPIPGSLEEALVDIEATWMEGNPEFLMWHVDHTGDVDVYSEGKYSHTLSPREIYKLTDEAVHRTDTLSFAFTDVENDSHTARAYARHEYRGPDGERRTAYLGYYLEKVRGRWVVDRIDIRKKPYGSSNCFIATAAFGSPMENEVIVLRQFREEYLLTSIPGRLCVAAYYRVSPPMADWIAEREWARAAVRGILRPVIQICRLLLR